jgi:hypothetical protein
MQGTPRTPQEIIDLVTRQVRQFEKAGLTHEGAVLAAALTLRVEPHKVSVLAPPEPRDAES